jgi:hypothetical protein
MPDLQLPHIDYLRQRDPRLAEAIEGIQSAINNLASQLGGAPVGSQNAPIPPQALNVTAAGGIFDIAISDPYPATTEVAPEYFLEYSASPTFSAPVVIHLGPARNHRAYLGNQTLYWRCYSQVGRASPPSALTYFGPVNAPAAVAGGGATSGPALLPSAGSGTGPTVSPLGGIGYGRLPVRLPISKRPGLE